MPATEEVAAPTLPRLLTTSEVAAVVRVTPRTVQNWIENQRIPHVELPGGQYRIPLQGLITSLSGNYDLNAELAVGESLVDDLEVIEQTASAAATEAEVLRSREGPAVEK
jgi:excisionase family DNA binding protein